MEFYTVDGITYTIVEIENEKRIKVHDKYVEDTKKFPGNIKLIIDNLGKINCSPKDEYGIENDRYYDFIGEDNFLKYYCFYDNKEYYSITGNSIEFIFREPNEEEIEELTNAGIISLSK